MDLLCFSVWSVLMVGSSVSYKSHFPQGFMFGTSSSANQIEGAWNVSGRTESMWDHFIHTRPSLVSDGSNADVSCDSYHMWRRDIEMVAEMGLATYRFSISWPRLLPSGFPNYINEDAKNYYDNLIDGLLEYGIEPIITIYHFDLPQSLQDLGGWANPLITEWFADYASIVFSLYADRVKFWITINEPILMCDAIYSEPFIQRSKPGIYMCNKNILLAHAKAWRIYDKKYKPKYHGKVSIVNLFMWFEPATPEDVELTQLTIEFWEGRYAYPIFSKEGGWPSRIENFLAENARNEGYSTSWLPKFTREEAELVRGTYDFYGLNHYSTRLVRKAKPGEEISSWLLNGASELGVVFESDPSWPSSAADWLKVYPIGIRPQLNWLNEMYGPLSILITENGYPSTDDGVHDAKRSEYIKGYLEQVLLAINDGVDVIGYNVWSLMDSFEFFGGYSAKFGLYAVNFSDPMRARTPRDSSKYYASVVRSRAIQDIDSI